MASNNKVFISAPISVDWSTVMEFAKSVQNTGGKPVYWERNTRYIQKDFDTADSVVFILPNNNFNMHRFNLPIGLQSELERAFETGKSIYVGYIRSNGNHSIYRAGTDGYSIAGRSGTSGRLKRDLESIKAAKRIAMNSNYGAFWSGEEQSVKWGELEHPGAEVKLPTAKKVNPDFIDERLLLML